MDSAQIQLVFGPMYSGKTSELIRRVTRFQHAKKSCCIIKYALDTRYSTEMLASHDKRLLPAIPCRLLSEISATTLAAYEVIAVDEGQFFPDIVEFAEACANSGKVVIVAALDGDFRRKPFGRILELIPLAERIDKLTAICTSCSADAAFTQRTVASTEIELIGGSESYRPVCRACFHGGSSSSAANKSRAAASVNMTPLPATASPSSTAASAQNQTPLSPQSPSSSSTSSSSSTISNASPTAESPNGGGGLFSSSSSAIITPTKS